MCWTSAPGAVHVVDDPALRHHRNDTRRESRAEISRLRSCINTASDGEVTARGDRGVLRAARGAPRSGQAVRARYISRIWQAKLENAQRRAWSRRSACMSPTPATSTAPTALPARAKYHGDRALMSFDVGKRALDFLVDHSGSTAESGGGLFRRRAADEL